jgi:hypothetical protein
MGEGLRGRARTLAFDVSVDERMTAAEDKTPVDEGFD